MTKCQTIQDEWGTCPSGLVYLDDAGHYLTDFTKRCERYLSCEAVTDSSIYGVDEVEWLECRPKGLPLTTPPSEGENATTTTNSPTALSQCTDLSNDQPSCESYKDCEWIGDEHDPPSGNSEEEEKRDEGLTYFRQRGHGRCLDSNYKLYDFLRFSIPTITIPMDYARTCEYISTKVSLQLGLRVVGMVVVREEASTSDQRHAHCDVLLDNVRLADTSSFTDPLGQQLSQNIGDFTGWNDQNDGDGPVVERASPRCYRRTSDRCVFRDNDNIVFESVGDGICTGPNGFEPLHINLEGIGQDKCRQAAAYTIDSIGLEVTGYSIWPGGYNTPAAGDGQVSYRCSIYFAKDQMVDLNLSMLRDNPDLHLASNPELKLPPGGLPDGIISGVLLPASIQQSTCYAINQERSRAMGNGSSNSSAMIIGGAISAAIGLCSVVFAIVYWRYKRDEHRNRHAADINHDDCTVSSHSSDGGDISENMETMIMEVVEEPSI